METKLKTTDFDFSAFSNWNELQEYLVKQGMSRAQLKSYYKQWTEQNAKPNALSSVDICDAIRAKTDGLKIDSVGVIYKDNKVVFKDESDLCRQLEKDFEDTGARFTFSALQKEVSARLKSLEPYDQAFETMQEVLKKDADSLPKNCPCDTWCGYALRHFGFPYDATTQKRFYDFIKRQMMRVNSTHQGRVDKSVLEMLVLYGEGNIGKSWFVDLLNVAAFGFTTPPIQDCDQFEVFDMQIQPQFRLIEEVLNGFSDNKIKAMITASKPLGRNCKKAMNAKDLCRASFVLSCNNIHDSFENLADCKDTGMMRRFFVLETTLKTGEKIEKDWTDSEMEKIMQNVVREAAKSPLLERHEIQMYNTMDFNKYVKQDNYIIKRIKLAIATCLETETFKGNQYVYNHKYPINSFRLWIGRGYTPSGVRCEDYPEFDSNKLKRTRLLENEINNIFETKREMSLFEIGQKIGFDFSRFDIEKKLSY